MAQNQKARNKDRDNQSSADVSSEKLGSDKLESKQAGQPTDDSGFDTSVDASSASDSTDFSGSGPADSTSTFGSASSTGEAVSGMDTLSSGQDRSSPWATEGASTGASSSATGSATGAGATGSATAGMGSSGAQGAGTSMETESQVDGVMVKAGAMLGGQNQAVKKNLNLVKQKAQDFIQRGSEQVTEKLHTLSDDVKLRGMMVDDSIKAKPYAYALGAVGLGFILGRAFSGKGKGDLDVLVSTINKLNLGALGSMLGLKTESGATTPANYNADQARKIG